VGRGKVGTGRPGEQHPKEKRVHRSLPDTCKYPTTNGHHMVFVTRKATFSAAHRLFNPTFTDEQNEAVFDKCNNILGHGHNYVLEVTVKGVPDPETGYVIDLKELKRILDLRVVDLVDHKHLNYDVEFLQGVIPTVENLCIAFWQQLEHHLPSGELHRIRVYESEANLADYYGEPVELARWEMGSASDLVVTGVRE
jgi:6-pyruvoyltetrahydropterin/6-carboxytetrahydropterin synthase